MIRKAKRLDFSISHVGLDTSLSPALSYPTPRVTSEAAPAPAQTNRNFKQMWKFSVPQCAAAAGANQRLCYRKYLKLISCSRTAYFYVAWLYPCRQCRVVSKCAEYSTTVTEHYTWSIIFCNIGTFPQLNHRIKTIRKLNVCMKI